MELLKSSQAGTLESSDIMILIEPVPKNNLAYNSELYYLRLLAIPCVINRVFRILNL